MTNPSHPVHAKLCTADEAAAAIPPGATVAVGGFIGAAHPEALTAAIETHFLAHGKPEGLTLIYAAGQGDAKKRGLNHFGHEGLVRRVVGGHWSLAPALGRMAMNNQIEAYNFPQGVICQLFRDIAAGRPGCITHVGLDTFIDPIHTGGMLNERTTEPLVERITLAGRDWLWYKAMPIDVALIRGTAADPYGNLVMDDEAIVGEVLAMAQAARNSGGKVFAQIGRVLDKPAPPKSVRVPGILIDRLIIGDAESQHQTFAEPFNATYCTAGDIDSPPPAIEPIEPGPRRIIALRALMEIPAGAVVNLGIGMPEGIARVAAERHMLSAFTLTVESGPIGGMPAGGLSFGAAMHPHAIVDQPSQFDFYDGRGLDFAALGAAQIDVAGNVNVSKFGPKLAGVGGFVNITQTAKRLVFCGTFTAAGLACHVEGNRLVIDEEGKLQKFITAVEQVSFSGERARQQKRDVLFITERAVFRLTPKGLELIEMAPGIDLDSQILALMAFKPIVRNIQPMPAEVFA